MQATGAVSLLCAGILGLAAAGPGSGQAQAGAQGHRQQAVTCDWTVILDEADGPPGWEQKARSVLAEASDITGVRIRIRSSAQADGESGKDSSAQVRIGWDRTRGESGQGLRAGQMGVAWTRSGPQGLEDSKIELNEEYWQASGPSRLSMDADELPEVLSGRSTVPLSLLLRHEIGHALGLDHRMDPTSVMVPLPSLYQGADRFDAQTAHELAAMYRGCQDA